MASTNSATEPNSKRRKIDEIAVHRKNLPIFDAKENLIQKVRQLNTAIIIGETGSGKTTQIPQYFYEYGLNRNKLIACTQPRRVAAVTIAQRVAQEKNVELGKLVGYSVRFDDMTSSDTKIKYMTDGMLLREAILDPLLMKYSIVLLDEAHERTIHTDVLFGIVKTAQQKRLNQNLLQLKIVVMSATMDVDHFSNYFSNAPVLYIEGRQFPVQVMYAKQTQSDYLFAALVTVFKIHKQAPPAHDILVFLTGQEEIESTVKCIKEVAKNLPADLPQLIAQPLYAALPSAQQLQVFKTTPKNARKVIVSTNIAETSVTIPGIKFVIDSGVLKAKTFNPKSSLDMLKVQKISQAQAWQRTGRAGRESDGTCYRLYTESEYEALTKNTIPEIQRCNLVSVVLQLLAMGVKDLMKFDFMDKPDSEYFEKAIEQLLLLDAVEKDSDLKLTSLGKQMAAFPLDPRFAKVIIKANELGCLEEVLTIVSLLSVESVLQTPSNKREQALATRQKFMSAEGDHITLLNVYRAYKSAKGAQGWCVDNFVNGRNMKTALDMRKQLREICATQRMKFKSCGQDTSLIRKCMTYGFFMNSAELHTDKLYKTIVMKKPVTIHPSSALFQCKPGCVIYNELVKTSKCYMRDICQVDPDWLFEIAPAYFKRKVASKSRLV
ncbi:ATP-dependent RNA helicase DHX33-like [Tubulanus polymorphus]|uniref:ATP-dependent RNA helicase DHX33-like n=1 Tax=Tubulanus polymorphus TaxID=672921 RepID=UPI003DA3F9CF